MSRPPKTTEVLPLVDPTIDQEKMTTAMETMREQAQEDQLELLELASDMGAIRALEMTRNIVAAATVRLFDKVRESKRIKDLPIRQPDGTVATATTVDEFCRLAFGKPRTAMIEASETLDILGEQAYEAASRLGLSRSALRISRALPPEKLEVVRNAISSGSAKAEVLAVIEDLAEKVQKAEDTTAETRAEVEAKEKLLADKNQQIDSLRTELTLNKNLVIAATDWPERFKGLMDQAQFSFKNLALCVGALDAVCEEALKAQPNGPAEEASMDRARAVLAEELLTIHRRCAEYLEAMGLKFDKTLGSYASEGLWK